MRRRSREKQRGVALLMVLIALTILGTMTADLMETNEVYLATAVNARDAMRAEYLAKSGVNLSRLTLSFRELLGSSTLPFWQYADMIISTFTSPGGGVLGDLTGANLADVEGLGLKGIGENADLKIDIIDEESKINVNVSNLTVRGHGATRMIYQLSSLMDPPAFDHLFTDSYGSGQLTEREDIICELIDFTDGDEDLCDLSGSEDRSLYSSLDPPYERKNAPFDSLEEIHLVSGINDDLWSAFVEPNSEDPKKRIMTVWGKGRINVNTAPVGVLLPVMWELAQDREETGAPLDPMQYIQLYGILTGIDLIRQFLPFSQINDFIKAVENPASIGMAEGVGIELSEEKKHRYRNVLTTRSTVFSIYSTATVGRVTKRIHMVVDMEAQVTLALPDEEPFALAGGKVLYYRMD
jgi:general secretion pathway protein K